MILHYNNQTQILSFFFFEIDLSSKFVLKKRVKLNFFFLLCERATTDPNLIGIGLCPLLNATGTDKKEKKISCNKTMSGDLYWMEEKDG